MAGAGQTREAGLSAVAMCCRGWLATLPPCVLQPSGPGQGDCVGRRRRHMPDGDQGGPRDGRGEERRGLVWVHGMGCHGLHGPLAFIQGAKLQAVLEPAPTARGLRAAVPRLQSGATPPPPKVTGAASDADARVVAKSVAGSSLTKAAIFGGDPNWGRIAAAAGYSGGWTGGARLGMGGSNPRSRIRRAGRDAELALGQAQIDRLGASCVPALAFAPTPHKPLGTPFHPGSTRCGV